MKIIAVEHCSCVYESGFSVISLHKMKNKREAARVMNSIKRGQFEQDLIALEINEDDEEGLCEYRRIEIIGESEKFEDFQYKIYEVE